MPDAAETVPVPVRGGEHGDYSRVVFDWERITGYSLSLGGSRLVIAFDEAADADFALVNPSVLENISNIEQVSGPGEPLRVSITIAGDTRVRDFNLGSKLVVDVLDTESQVAAASPEAGSEEPPAGDEAMAAAPTEDDGAVSAEADAGATQEAEADPPVVVAGAADEPADGEATDEQAAGEQATGEQASEVPEPEPAAEDPDIEDAATAEADGEAADAEAEVTIVAEEPSEPTAEVAQDEDVTDEPATAETPAEPEPETPPEVAADADTVSPEEPAAAAVVDEPDALEPDAPETDVAAMDEPPAETAEPMAVDEPEAEVAEAEQDETEIAEVPVVEAPAPVGDEPAVAADEPVVEEEVGAGTDVANLDAGVETSAGEPPVEETVTAAIEPEPEAAEEEPVFVPPADATASAAPAPEAVPTEPLEEQALEQRAVFDPGVPSLLSVFRRGDALWVVMAAESPMDPTQLAAQGSRGFGPGEIAAADGGVALRYLVDPDLYPSIENDGTRWTVTLVDRPQTNSRLVEVIPQPEFPLGPRVLVEAEGVQGLVRVADPEIGDVLVVAPLETPSMGLARERRFVEVRLLASTQGLVAELLADSVTMRIVRQGVEITTSDGLILSPLGDRRASTINTFGAPIADSLFRVGDWQGPPAQFNKRRQALQRNVAVAAEENIDRARLDLARFYFAHGYGSEALGLLTLMESDDAGLPDTPAFRALSGAVKLITGRSEEALEDFDHPELRNREEVALWRAAAHADKADWAAAEENFALARPLIGAYPEPYRDFFYTRAGRAALKTGKTDIVNSLVQDMSTSTDGASDDWDITHYFRGARALQAGDLSTAERELRMAAASTDPKIHVLARLALVEQGTRQGTMAPEEAADELESLRFAWRGDEIEYDISEQLGDRYWEMARYHDAIKNWQRAIDAFPNHEPARELAEALPGRVADLIVEDGADGGLNPLRAAALYSEFEDILPEGERRTEVQSAVVDKLVSIDLLGRASDMLKQLSRERLDGEDAIRAALREAGLNLLQNRPEKTLETLDWTETQMASAVAPGDLESERRLLRADALARLGQPEPALALLQDEDSRLGTAAKVNIAWKAGLWPEAADALSDLVGLPPPEGEEISAGQADTVINYGIALALSGNAEELAALADTFGPALGESSRAPVFRILTRGEAPLEPIRDLASVRRQSTEIELFRDFLEGYRASATTVASTEG